MNQDRPISRRAFLEKAATITAIGFAAPHLVAGAQPAARPKPGPNSRIHVGLIGCGGMGRANLANCAKEPDVVITAACDVWESRRAAVVQQFKDTCKGYRDFQQMLQQPDLDAVIIATPPHWHALNAIAACEAGKDIYLQKPMTRHLAESFAVRNAVKKHNRISQVGTQIHASENYRRVVELIRSGNLGPVSTIRTFNVMNQLPDGVGQSPPTPQPAGLDWDLWCGPAPLRPFNPILANNSYNHCSWMEYSGGWTPGMAPHIIDLPVWALDLGFPLSTSSSGGRYLLKDDGDAYDNHEVLWQYPGLTMTWMSSLTNSYGFDFEGDPKPRRRLGMYFHGANGTLAADYGTLKVIPEGDKMNGFETPPQSIPPSPGHEREWLDCIKSRQQPSCSVFYHMRVDVPIALSLLSLKLGRTIRFDARSERIVGDTEAARLAVPRYRAPWKFPKTYLNT
ncbi:MAG TPA: Gfo/Idh/MocA family oxidoreductase [Candidatus Paceibacterota bacterium]|nr:Gfo/Idh/MocA family oxidoreductase [Verrucomicrobiota bacterium]HSA08994.1 Gfo/Idh/MocA family oxidoreductase [Candidatus Paceibacterota bacterium]